MSLKVGKRALRVGNGVVVLHDVVRRIEVSGVALAARALVLLRGGVRGCGTLAVRHPKLGAWSRHFV